MKYLLCLAVVATLAFYGCQNDDKRPGELDTELIHNPNTGDANAKVDTNKLPVMVFDTLEHNFGSIREGEKATYEFKFTNKGNSSLLVTSVEASCGCTTPYYPKNIIKPGASEAIKVVFDSEKRPGSFNKTVTVTANTYPSQTRLRITGTVIAKNDN